MTAREKDAITKLQIGVWTVALHNSSESSPVFLRLWRSLVLSVLLYLRLSKDLFAAEPRIFLLHIVLSAWRSVKPALLMFTSNQLLATIEKTLLSPDSKVNDIILIVAVHTFVSSLSAMESWARENIVMPRLRTSFCYHFRYRLLKAHCNMDVVTAQSPMARKRVSHILAWWYYYQTLTQYMWTLPQVLTQITLLLFTAGKMDYPIMLVLCLIAPLYDVWVEKSLYNISHISYTDNSNYKRMKSLVQMTSNFYRSEVKSGNLVARIISEYERCSEALAKEKIYFERSPREQHRNQISLASKITSKVLGDTSTLVYLAVVVALNPSQFSVATFFSMMKMCTKTSETFAQLMLFMRHSDASTSHLRALYELLEMPNILVDGSVMYPRPDVSSIKGMSFELRDLSFSYPGSQSAKPALQNISLSISAGQIVVIVGANGGGKSTIINMLTRLYDPSSAPDSLVVDGLPISDYNLESLRRATAVLTQDHSLFPLSLKENIGIGLGDSGKVDDATAIQRAAEDGGATHCLDKFEAGMDTVLSQKLLSEPRMMSLKTESGDVDEAHPLAKKIAELKKDVEVSGGEKQRIVAARTFMRLQSKAIRLVVVDEPTSALDPEGEMQVFDNLIRARQGRTMVFVTHRFGHLVKRADLVVCIKDGGIVESGSHEKLIGQNGEYAKLYEIQAKAFVGPK